MGMAAVGIPVSNLAYANEITFLGYPQRVARFNRRRGLDLATMNMAFQTALNSGPIDASKIQMHRDLATTIYHLPAGIPGLAGLGEDTSWMSTPEMDAVDELINSGRFDEPDPPDQANDDKPWWGDVLKTFGGAIGLGVAGRIAGVNPFARQTVITTPAVSTPVKVALIGGGVVAGAYILSRLLKPSRR